MSALDTVQTLRAKQLRTIRPAVLPGTDAIPNQEQRTAWYAIVSLTMDALEIDGSAQTNEFCDIAGVAS